MEVYLVGGAVRDELLGIPVTERDWVVVGATPDEMESQGFKAIGKDFPVFLHPESKEEYALARTEKKRGRGYHEFEFHSTPEVSLEEDLLRRDLTINAIAQSESGEIIDPYGGQDDLNKKVLRHVSDAFTEDPLRVLRVARLAARFHTLSFKIDKETMSLMRQIVATRELREISLERIWKETAKGLLTESPSTYFDVLQQTHALSQVFPYIYYPYSDLESRKLGLATLDKISKDYADENIRFAALIGGLLFYSTQEYKSDITKLVNEFPLPNKCKKLISLTIELQHDCHNALRLEKEDLLRVVRKLDARRNPKQANIILDICKVIYISLPTNKTYKQKHFIQTAANEIEKVSVDTWIREQVSVEELTKNIHNAQLELLENLIQSYK